MTKMKLAAILIAATGCAGLGSSTMRDKDVATGHWDGSIFRDGWQRPLSLELAAESGAWRGEWRSLQTGPGMALRGIEVRGDEVRFDTDRFRFVGRLKGNTLSGTVLDLSAGGPAGEFSVSREDPRLLADY